MKLPFIITSCLSLSLVILFALRSILADNIVATPVYDCCLHGISFLIYLFLI